MSTLVITSDMVEHPAGDIALEGLAAFERGDYSAARRAAARARRESGSAFAARYIDGLAYAAIGAVNTAGRVSIGGAESAVKRFLIALDDPRQARFPVRLASPAA